MKKKNSFLLIVFIASIVILSSQLCLAKTIDKKQPQNKFITTINANSADNVEQKIGVQNKTDETKTPLLQKFLKTWNEAKPVTEPEISSTSNFVGEDVLAEIQITGNVLVPTSFIRDEIFLQPGDTLNPYKIDRVTKSILTLGLFADVTTEIKKLNQGKLLIVRVKENPIVSSIVIANNTVIPTENILPQLRVKPGAILNINSVRIDINTIETIYQQNGYRWSKVANVILPKSNDEPLVFQMQEGKLSEVIISGNIKTQDYVITREMDLKPGSVLKDQILQEDLRRIYNLNYFSSLVPDLIPTTANNYALVLDIQEKSSQSVNFGGGYGQTSGFFGFVDLNLDNFMGTGQLVGLKTQIGKTTTFEVKYFNPWITDDRKSLGFKVWRSSGLMDYADPITHVITDRNETRMGGEVTYGWPFSYFLRTYHTLKAETVQPETDNWYKIFSYKFTISYDTRDVWFNPRKGYFASLDVEKGLKPTFLGTVFNNATDFLKTDLDSRYFHQLFENQVVALRFCAGYMNGDLALKQPYYVGGSNTVRGYDNLNPFGVGNKRVFANFEYRLLFNDTFSAVGFVDVGAASFQTLFNLNLFHWGKGLGLRINTPIGPIRLDYGFGDSGKGIFYFNIGHTY